MIDKFVLQNTVRPPVEFFSVGVCMIAIAAIWYYPATFSIYVLVNDCLILIFSIIAVKNICVGFNLLRYRYNIHCQGIYLVDCRKKLVYEHKLLWGRGFLWTARHSQRLNAVDKNNKSTPGFLFALIKSMRWLLYKFLCSSYLTQFLQKYSPFWQEKISLQNNFVSGNLAIHGVELKEKNIFMDLKARQGHTLIAGTTGVGKTRLCEFLVCQDIRRGDTTIVICPKGDIELLKRVYAEACRANRVFYCFHLGYPEMSCRYNGVGTFSRITEVATRITNQLPSSGDAAAFKEFSWRFINIIAQALVNLNERCTYDKIQRYIDDCEPLFLRYAQSVLSKLDIIDWQVSISRIEYRLKRNKQKKSHYSLRAQALVEYLRRSGIDNTVLNGLCKIIDYDKAFYQKLVAAVSPLLEKLTTGEIAELISPDYKDRNNWRPILDWMTAIKQNAIVYIGLDGLTDMTVAAAVGKSMFADIVSVTGKIYKHGVRQDKYNPGKIIYPTVRIHADEFSALIADEFIPLLNRSRGAGIDIVAYTQTIADIEVGLQSRSKAKQIVGNFNTFVVLRVVDADTAQVIIDKLPVIDIVKVLANSSTTDSSQFSQGVLFETRNEDNRTQVEKPLLELSNLIALPNGNAFLLTGGGELYKIRFPLLSTKNDQYMPNTIMDIVIDMQQRYRQCKAFSN